MTKILLSSLCIAAIGGSIAGIAGCTSGGNSNSSRPQNITVSGSSSVTPIMESLAAEYEKDHNVRITVNMSSSGAGISDTQKGLNDLGMVSRDLAKEETGVKAETLCRDGIALIVNKESSVANVSKEDVKALFESNTPIPDTSITAAIGRGASSGTRSAFDELMGIEEYHQKVSTLDETGNVIEAIQGSTNSIGYISYGSLTSAVKAVSLDGVECNMETISNGDYALQRPFVIIQKEGKALSAAAQGFYDYIMSEEAQTIITGSGYISVR